MHTDTHLLADYCGSCTGWDQKGSAYGYCTADASGMAVKTMHDHPCHVPPVLRVAMIEDAMDDVLAQQREERVA